MFYKKKYCPYTLKYYTTFHYHYIKNKYGNNSRLLFTGTDILMHETKTEDVYEDFSNDKEMYGFSNYSAK